MRERETDQGNDLKYFGCFKEMNRFNLPTHD